MPTVPPTIPTNSRLTSPSAERNKGPIAELLLRLLPSQGTVLEVSSGTGQHVVHFAQAMPHLRWQPTERDAGSLASIAAWAEAAQLPNIGAPLTLDVHDAVWPVAKVDAVICLNMIHIAPPSATEALLAGAAQVIAPGGMLFLYGPFRRHGVHTAPSNEAFDASLKARNPEWGVRNLEDVAERVAAHGLALEAVHEMPTNNLSIVSRKR